MDRADCNKGNVINASRDIRPPKQARNCYTSTGRSLLHGVSYYRSISLYQSKLAWHFWQTRETQLHYNWTTCRRALHDNMIIAKTVTDFPGSLPFPQEANTGLYNGLSTKHFLATYLFMIHFHVISQIVNYLHVFQIQLHSNRVFQRALGLHVTCSKGR